MRALRAHPELEKRHRSAVRELADRAFSRAAGAPLVGGNQVRLLLDGPENYPRWFDVIRAAKKHVHFESYFVREDETGLELAELLASKAREGVRVRVIYDWLGGFFKASRSFWNELRKAGVEVRAYNPPQLASPLGWLSRDHRKMLTVDGEVGFIHGLCVGKDWLGHPERGIEPWRDTGVEVRGCAVAEIEAAFARMWSLCGDPLPDDAAIATPAPAGDVDMRIVSSEPSTAGMLRIDQLVASLARSRLWLSDAYYAGTPSYVQALRAAAEDGVDVRLLVPGASDIPMLKPLSRAGYRPLLEAGVRIFEWNGTMMHAKTAVADGRWARVGSTNLNMASWFGNCELDAVIEDEGFAREMEAVYLRDLENASEVVLDERRRVRAPNDRGPRTWRKGGSTTRAAAGAIRMGNAVGAALANRRVLGAVEAQLTAGTGLLLVVFAVLAALFPRALAYPVAALLAWGGVTLLLRSIGLWRARRAQRENALVRSDRGQRATELEAVVPAKPDQRRT